MTRTLRGNCFSNVDIRMSYEAGLVRKTLYCTGAKEYDGARPVGCLACSVWKKSGCCVRLRCWPDLLEFQLSFQSHSLPWWQRVRIQQIAPRKSVARALYAGTRQDVKLPG